MTPTANENEANAAALVAAAYEQTTPGEWVHGQPNDGEAFSIVKFREGYSLQWEAVIVEKMAKEADAEFIALAHNSWPAILARLKALEAFVERASKNVPVANYANPQTLMNLLSDYHFRIVNEARELLAQAPANAVSAAGDEGLTTNDTKGD